MSARSARNASDPSSRAGLEGHDVTLEVARPRVTPERDILRLSDVHFSYPDGTPVINGLSLAVPRGAIVGIVGPSGCGKSTLLNLLAGIARPTAGRIERDFVPGTHPISMVFQKDTVLPWLTVAENVTFYARFKTHGVKRGLIKRLTSRRSRGGAGVLEPDVADLLRFIGLLDRADAYPYQLSGGMRRRLAFLTAVAAKPQVLLLDEPFSSVDEPTRIGIHQDVFRIARSMQMTAILVTHDLAEAISLCDQVLILSSRPTSVVRNEAMPFGDDRQMFELRETPEFLEAYANLWHALTAQIRTPTTQQGPNDV
jgi:NitT/TauT family transport system ATP-binding protein